MIVEAGLQGDRGEIEPPAPADRLGDQLLGVVEAHQPADLLRAHPEFALEHRPQLPRTQMHVLRQTVHGARARGTGPSRSTPRQLRPAAGRSRAVVDPAAEIGLHQPEPLAGQVVSRSKPLPDPPGLRSEHVTTVRGQHARARGPASRTPRAPPTDGRPAGSRPGSRAAPRTPGRDASPPISTSWRCASGPNASSSVSPVTTGPSSEKMKVRYGDGNPRWIRVSSPVAAYPTVAGHETRRAGAAPGGTPAPLPILSCRSRASVWRGGRTLSVLPGSCQRSTS